MTRFLRIIVVLAFLPLACARAEGKPKTDDVINDYMQLYSSALRSADRKYIADTIVLIKNKYMGKADAISSIYYNLSQLYHKIGLNDEAINSLKADKGPSGEFYLGTLLVRIGRKKDAQVLFSKLHSDLMSKLTSDQLDTKSKSSIVESLFIISIFLDLDINSSAKEIIDKGLLMQDAVDEIKSRTNVPKEVLLDNMWPD
jgi:hypothetical protein